MPDTREAWLIEGAKDLKLLLEKKAPSYFLPPFHVSVGWPRGARGRGKAIGQCWQGYRSADGNPHIFISPILGSPVEILATLLHELVHALVEAHKEGVKAIGHKGVFIEVAKAVGLVKPWTATSPSEDLKVQLEALALKLGEFPHAALNEALKGKKKGSRLRLWECECGVKARVASDDFQATCGKCEGEFKQKDKEEEEEEEE